MRIIEKHLPNWCREIMILENNSLKGEIKALQAKNSNLNAYIDGLEKACRLMRKVVTIKGEPSA